MLNPNWLPVIDSSQPFKGACETGVYLDATGVQRVQYSGSLYNENKGDLSFDAYKALRENPNLTIISWVEYDALNDNFLKSLITPPVLISEEQHTEAFECLPPSRMMQVAGFFLFHVCERITGNLVSWYAQRGDTYLTFTNAADISKEELSKILTESPLTN